MKLGCKDKGIRKSEFVAKTQFLYTDKTTELVQLRYKSFPVPGA